MFGKFFGKKSAPEQPGAMTEDERQLAERCQTGDRADWLCSQGMHREAIAAYETLLTGAAGGDAADAYIGAKAALGIHLARIRAGLPEPAGLPWTPDLPGAEYLQRGAHTLAAHDEALYHMVAAYHHARGPDPATALDRVDHFMKGVADFNRQGTSQRQREVTSLWYALYQIISTFDLTEDLRQRVRAHYAGLTPADEPAVDRLITRGDSSLVFNERKLALLFPKPTAWGRAP